MPANGIIKAPRDQKPLIGPRPASEGTPEQSTDLGQAGAHVVRAALGSKDAGAGATLKLVRGLHEVVGCFDPAGLRHRSSLQKQEPGTARGRDRFFQSGAYR